MNLTETKEFVTGLVATRRRILQRSRRATLFDSATRKTNRMPIVYGQDGLVLTKEHAYATHSIPMRPWGFLSDKVEKNQFRATTGFFAQSYPAKQDTAGHLIVTNRVYSAEDWYANIIRSAAETGMARPTLANYVNASREILNTNEFFEREAFLITRMGHRAERDGIAGMLRAGLEQLLIGFALDDDSPADEEVTFWANASDTLGSALGSSYLGCQPIDRQKTEWLLRHLDSPGLPTPQVSPISPMDPENWGFGQWQTVLASMTEIVELGRDEDKEKLDCVEFDGPTGKSYAAFLPLSHMPRAINYNVNWLHHLTRLPFPVDVSLHFQIIDADRAEKALEKGMWHADAQAAEDREANFEPDEETLEQRSQLEAVKTQTRQAKVPLAYWQCVFMVADQTKEGLLKKVTELRSHYKRSHFRLECPREDQRELFYQSLPGSEQLVQDWIQKTDVQYLAAAAPWLSSNVGDGKGLYQGYTLNVDNNGVIQKGAPFFFDPHSVVDDQGKAPTEAVAAFPGSGKTVSRGLKCALEDAYKGVTQFIWDPKGDFIPLRTYCVDMGLDPNKVNLIDLEDPNSSVSLDAFAIAEVDPEQEIDERNSLAREILERLLEKYLTGQNTAVLYTAVLGKAVDEVLAAERFDAERPGRTIAKPSMAGLLKLLGEWKRSSFGDLPDLRNNEQRRDDWAGAAGVMYDELERVRVTKHGRLLFREVSESVRSMSLVPGSMTIFVAMGLKPLEEGEKENQGTIISDIIAGLMTDYIRTLLADKKIEFHQKAARFDEWHAIKRTSRAVALHGWLKRMGRSRRCTVQTLSQSANDHDKGSLTTVWCGWVENDEEAAASCDLLGIEASRANMDRLQNLKAGQFLFRDAFGRVAWVQVDIWDEWLLERFNTQARERQALKEKEAAAGRAS